MNIQKLKRSEKDFLATYPSGFSHPDLVAIGKKHNVGKLADFCLTAFASKNFHQTDEILENWIRVISRSSMVSVFEKPKFRSFVNLLMGSERTALAQSLYELLHGSPKSGFQLQVDL